MRNIQTASEMTRIEGGNTKRTSDLCGLQGSLPLGVDGIRLFGHDHHVTGTQLCPQRSTTTTHGTIRADDENSFLVRHLGRSARLVQVPATVLPWLKGYRRWVINRAINNHNVSPLGDIDLIAVSHKDIARCVGPVPVVRNMDDQAPCRRRVYQIC